MGDTKICLKCGRELPTSEFSKCKNNKDGLQVYCKECNKQYKEEHKKETSEYMKRRYQNNREAILKYDKQYYRDNIEAKLEYAKQYREEHKEEILEKKKQYYTDNRETKLEYMKQHYSTLRGYCGHIRRDNIREDRKYDRIGNELPNDYPTVEDYMELLQLPDFYDGKQYNFNEMGLDRIDNSLPHILSNVVPCTTKHNAQRGRMPFEEFCSLFTLKTWDGFQFMFIETVKDMEKIIRMNGYVYLVIEHDVYGRHTTFKILGKDPDDPMWADELNGTKPNKKKNKKETD